MWAMLAAPLMAGNDLRYIDKSIAGILTNHEIIAIDQDPLGHQARKFKDMGEHEIWVKPLINNEIAICFMNRSDRSWLLNYEWEKEILNFGKDPNGHTKVYRIRDLWEHETIGKTDERLVKEIAPLVALLFFATAINYIDRQVFVFYQIKTIQSVKDKTWDQQHKFTQK